MFLPGFKSHTSAQDQCVHVKHTDGHIVVKAEVILMIEETRFKCLNLNVRSKMRFSQRLKLCVNAFHIFFTLDDL